MFGRNWMDSKPLVCILFTVGPKEELRPPMGDTYTNSLYVFSPHVPNLRSARISHQIVEFMWISCGFHIVYPVG